MRARTAPQHAARLALLSAVIAISSSAAAQGETRRASLAKGAQQLTVQGGYGVGFPLIAERGEDAASVHEGALTARFGVGISKTQGAGAWYEGRWAGGLEAQLLFATAPNDGLGGGLIADLRYDFLSAERCVTFVELGVGVGSIDFDLADQADGFNFLLQGGVGVHVFVAPRAALTAEVRWHHISNAGLERQNHGINDALFLIGPTFFWK